MNANELADELEDCGKFFEDRLYTKAAAMLRQQQAEIEALKTHPAELTDEEIDYCWTHSHGNTPWMKQKAFARAILNKAQEADKIESLGTIHIGGVHFRNGKEVK